MKSRLSIILIALGIAAALSLSATGTAKAQGVELSDTVTITAVVVAIDKKDRTVALLGPKGNVVALVVGEEARNFDQVKVGDRVKVKIV